ncbi:hypothetical protein [Pseudomonas umsongensis]|uniref:hypothetical protein n=1 Tax=Pseudomonas umsongensis TaxID=198618 RepID=UPI00200A991F|nr:hypothetical protein [Pseudomonas umsongensis]MCK8655421.1 hypothetical protein [Pseudomonas umsongensis]
MRLLIIITALIALSPITSGYASSCSAKNDAGGSCSISCADGQKAFCQDSSGGSAPECECQNNLTNRNFKLEKSAPKIGMLNLEQPLSSTNAVTVLNGILAAQRDINLREVCTKVESGKQSCKTIRMPCAAPDKPVLMQAPIREVLCSDLECRPIYKDSCTIAVGKLTVAGPISADADVKVKVTEPNWDGIPVEYLARKLTFMNCSNAEQNQQFSYSQDITTGGRVVMTKAIENTTNSSFKLGFSYVVSGEASVSFSKKVSFTDQQEQNFQEKSTISEVYPIKIPPQSTTTFEIAWRKIEVPVKFNGVAVVDAPLSNNLENILFASQLVPDPKDRSIAFEGVVYDTNVFGASIKNIATPLNPHACEGKENSLMLISNDPI